MTNMGPTPEPDDGLLRRGLFTRREPSPAEPLMTAGEYRLADTMQRAIDERLELGVRTIEEQATALLREVATEVWRSSSRDVRPEQERIMTILARDQAIRSLIASSDERFQSLAVRTARLEDHLNDLSESERRTREAMEHSAEAIREVASSPTLHGMDVVRTQLEQVERHIAEAFAHMDERDKHLTETVLIQVKEHGELIATETTRVVEAMQGYVQGGAEAVGRLAQRIEEHAQMFITQDHDITEHVREVVANEVSELAQSLDLVREKVGLHGRDQDLLRAQIENLLEARIRGLAELIRSDTTTLRSLIEERAATELAGGLDETTVIRLVDERMGAMERIVVERMAGLERTIGEEVLALSTAMGASVEHQVERMTAAAGAMDGVDAMIAESQSAFEERMLAQLDDRMTAIARLIRSDNQALAGRIGQLDAGREGAEPVDQEVLRSLVRSVKELQAGMASDMLGTMDRRFQAMSDQLHREGQSQAEAMVKVAEILGQKIDRVANPCGSGDGRRHPDRGGPHVRRDPCDVLRQPPRHRLIEPDDGLALADRLFRDAVALDRDPRVERDRPGIPVHRGDPSTGDDLLAGEDRCTELGGDADRPGPGRRPTRRRMPLGAPS